MLEVGFTRKEDILACDVNEERLAEVRKRHGVSVSAQNSEAPKFGGTLVIAVPPPKVLRVVNEIRDLVERDHLVISMAASVPLDELEKVLGKQVQVVRIMPNTPSLVGMGSSTYSVGVTTVVYEGESDTFALPLRPMENHTLDWYCDAVPDVEGMAFMIFELWMYHAEEMPQGVYDVDVLQGEGYQISIDGPSSKFTFAGY